MIEFYPQIKSVHILAVFASGLLFALRGGALLAGARWPNALVVRIASWTIDTTLLTAALMLFTLLPKALFANGWLATKIVLLVVYIGLGTVALKRARSGRARTIAYVAALATFAYIVSVARAHHPLGVFYPLFA
ncbi:MAG TPA: SirB2 family protein [Lysobacter sp.]|nr:SirB2 family protein [Lysobacter sp.]